jgi:hypothetical protein
MFAITLLCAACSAPADAYDRVLCFTDSKCNFPTTETGYCAQLAALRPDLDVRTNCQNNRNTVQALAVAQTVFDTECPSGVSCLVLIDHGTNDWWVDPNDPLSAAKRLGEMWDKAETRTRDAWVFTQTPAMSPWPAALNVFTRAVNHKLMGLQTPNPVEFDVRDLFVIIGWEHETDSVHVNEAGAQRIAEALAAAIP